jgi:hypothetical protein
MATATSLDISALQFQLRSLLHSEAVISLSLMDEVVRLTEHFFHRKFVECLLVSFVFTES